MLLLGAGTGRTRAATRSDAVSNPHASRASLAWDPRFYLAGPDRPGYALLADDEYLYLGGSFYGIGPEAFRSIARFDGSTWTPVGSGIEGEVRSLSRYRSRLIAGGDFRQAGGVEATNIASWDGETWNPLGAGVDGAIRSSVLFGDDLVVAGEFDSAGGNPASHIARWDGTRWLPFGEGLPGAVTGVAVYRGELYAACLYFYYTDSHARSAYVSRWSGSAWVPVATGEPVLTWGAQPTIDGLFVHEDRLFAFGDKMSIEGGLGGLCSWDGSIWRDAGRYGRSDPEDGSAPVLAAITWRGDLVVGGSFGNLDVGDRAGIAIGNSSGWAPPAGGGFNGSVRAFAVFRGDLFAAGGFYMAGSLVAPNLARNDGNGWSAITTGGQGIVGNVWAVTWLGRDVIAGGEFTQAGELPVQNIARWDGNNWQPMGTGLNGPVQRLIPFAGGVVAAGGFSRAGEVDASRIAFWNGTDWLPLGAGFQGGWMGDIMEFQGELIAGGRFESSGGQSVPYVARWDSRGWRPMPGLDGAVTCLTTYKGSLMAGGDFAGHLSLWTGTTWRSFGSEIHSRPDALAVPAFGLFVAGGYSWAAPNGWWDGTVWRPMRFGDYRVQPRAFADHAGRLLAGIRPYDTWVPTGLFAWSDSTFVPVPDGPVGTVRALQASGARLALGGDFTVAGGRSSWKFALAVDPAFPEASAFSASRRGTTVVITWQVSLGGERAIWRVYRNETGRPQVLVTPESLSGRAAYEVTDLDPPDGEADYFLEQRAPGGVSSAWYGPVHLTARPPSRCCETMEIEPNPASGSIILRFSLASSGSIHGTLLDVAGRQVAEIRTRLVTAGEQEVSWNPRTSGDRPVPSGIYWLRLESTEGMRTLRVVWLS